MHEPSSSSETYILNVLNEYRHELYRYCRMVTRSAWDAEDLVQETLVKLFALGKKAQVPLQKAYIFRTATNAWIDMCRKKRVPFQVMPDEPDIPAAQPADPVELEESLESLLAILPASQATVWLLVDVFRFTAKETAGMIESTEGAVKALLHRARSGLRKSVEPEKNDWRSPSPAKQVSRSSASPRPLMRRFMEAFRRDDPYEISRAYMQLVHREIEVGQQAQGGALYFRFRDPEGHLCVIESAELFL